MDPVFKRPFCTDFLKFCFERFEVAIFSSAETECVYEVLSSIFDDETTSQFEFVWGQEKCIDTGFFSVGIATPPKKVFLKILQQTWQNGKYSSSNTLLIDVEPETCLLNPPNNAMFPPPYNKNDRADTYLGPNGELRAFLEGLESANDVPSYVKEHRIGQPAITQSHQNWDTYRSIFQDFFTRFTRAMWVDSLVENFISEDPDSPNSEASTSSSTYDRSSTFVMEEIVARLDKISDDLRKLEERQDRVESSPILSDP